MLTPQHHNHSKHYSKWWNTNNDNPMKHLLTPHKLIVSLSRYLGLLHVPSLACFMTSLLLFCECVACAVKCLFVAFGARSSGNAWMGEVGKQLEQKEERKAKASECPDVLILTVSSLCQSLPALLSLYPPTQEPGRAPISEVRAGETKLFFPLWGMQRWPGQSEQTSERIRCTSAELVRNSIWAASHWEKGWQTQLYKKTPGDRIARVVWAEVQVNMKSPIYRWEYWKECLQFLFCYWIFTKNISNS